MSPESLLAATTLPQGLKPEFLARRKNAKAEALAYLEATTGNIEATTGNIEATTGKNKAGSQSLQAFS
jgi:hypothetical protein